MRNKKATKIFWIEERAIASPTYTISSNYFQHKPNAIQYGKNGTPNCLGWVEVVLKSTKRCDRKIIIILVQV
jgi:hypothetical protein